MIWNGKSNGARADIELLKASGKPFKVYMPESAVKREEKEKERDENLDERFSDATNSNIW